MASLRDSPAVKSAACSVGADGVSDEIVHCAASEDSAVVATPSSSTRLRAELPVSPPVGRDSCELMIVKLPLCRWVFMDG